MRTPVLPLKGMAKQKQSLRTLFKPPIYVRGNGWIKRVLSDASYLILQTRVRRASLSALLSRLRLRDFKDPLRAEERTQNTASKNRSVPIYIGVSAFDGLSA